MNKINPIRETDDEAIELAGSLICNAMHGVLAAHDAASAHPHVSRIQLSISDQGNLVTLISSLSSHTKCLLADPVCSILIGEPGKGDPLAHPRISVPLLANPVDRQSPAHQLLRASHLRHYPKAELYVDFGDFSFFELEPQGAALNGGFGKAYELTREEITAAIMKGRKHV